MGIGRCPGGAGGGAALSACGAPGPAGRGEAANPSAQPVTVRFHSRGGAPGHPGAHALRRADAPVHAEAPQHQGGPRGLHRRGLPAKITVLSAGNSLGDVMWTAIGGGIIYYFAASKTIQPVEPYVAKEKFDLAQYYKNVIEGLKRDGKLYGLPFKSHPGVSVLFYNQTAYEKSGAVPDKTWTLDRLVDGAKRATQGDVFGYNPAVSPEVHPHLHPRLRRRTARPGGQEDPAQLAPGGGRPSPGCTRPSTSTTSPPGPPWPPSRAGWTRCSPTASSPPGSGARPSSSSRSGTSRTPSSGSPPCTPRGRRASPARTTRRTPTP